MESGGGITYEKGIKHDQGKLDWSQLPMEALEEVIKGLMVGAEKYDDYNWVKVEPNRKRFWNAAMRHMVAYRKGEMFDLGEGGTGCYHLALAICNLLFILHKDIEADDNNLRFINE